MDSLNFDQFGIKPRGTFTRFNVERTYQTMIMKKKLFSKPEKSITICCSKHFEMNWITWKMLDDNAMLKELPSKYQLYLIAQMDGKPLLL